jgi:hypothetical protein
MAEERTHEERQTRLLEQAVKDLGDIKAAIYGLIIAWVAAAVFLYAAINNTDGL